MRGRPSLREGPAEGGQCCRRQHAPARLSRSSKTKKAAIPTAFKISEDHQPFRSFFLPESTTPRMISTEPPIAIAVIGSPRTIPAETIVMNGFA